jgi:hypothetical protein
LSGTLFLPHDVVPPYPVVIFVMGSGPATRNGYGSLPPLWSAFAEAGIASFAWDKPGVGASTGDWRAQSNHDRASEAVAALESIAHHPAIDGARIIVWGISQAGWVLPLMFQHTPRIAGLIAVSVPVGTGAEQELYRVAHTLPADGFSDDETRAAVAFTRQRLALMQQKAPFEQVLTLQTIHRHESWFEALGWLDEAQYRFLQTNAFFSPEPLLRAIPCPILALFGEKDCIVDHQESRTWFTALANQRDDATIRVHRFADADHVLFKSERGSTAELNRSFADASAAYVEGYIPLMVGWIKQHVGGEPSR